MASFLIGSQSRKKVHSFHSVALRYTPELTEGRYWLKCEGKSETIDWTSSEKRIIKVATLRLPLLEFFFELLRFHFLRKWKRNSSFLTRHAIPRPTVLVLHAWLKRDSFRRKESASGLHLPEALHCHFWQWRLALARAECFERFHLKTFLGWPGPGSLHSLRFPSFLSLSLDVGKRNWFFVLNQLVKEKKKKEVAILFSFFELLRFHFLRKWKRNSSFFNQACNTKILRILVLHAWLKKGIVITDHNSEWCLHLHHSRNEYFSSLRLEMF